LKEQEKFNQELNAYTVATGDSEAHCKKVELVLHKIYTALRDVTNRMNQHNFEEMDE